MRKNSKRCKKLLHFFSIYTKWNSFNSSNFEFREANSLLQWCKASVLHKVTLSCFMASFIFLKKFEMQQQIRKNFSMQISLTFFKVPFIFSKKFLMQQKIGKFFHKIWQLTFYQNSNVIWLKVCYSNSEHQFCIRSYLHLRKNLKHWKKKVCFFLNLLKLY